MFRFLCHDKKIDLSETAYATQSALGSFRVAHRKKFYFERLAPDIRCVAIGGSHVDYGIDPSVFRLKTFNFGLTSLDLFGMYHLLRYIVRRAPKLKTVIVRYGFFSCGNELVKTSECWRCGAYKHLFNIPYPVKVNVPMPKAPVDEYVGDYYGYHNPQYFMSIPAEQRIKPHLKHFYRNTSQLKYLRKIARICRRRHLKLILFLPPNRSDYSALVPDIVLSKSIKYMKKYAPGAQVYSFFTKIPGANGFDDSDFGDTDHTNNTGARKLSWRLNDVMGL